MTQHKEPLCHLDHIPDGGSKSLQYGEYSLFAIRKGQTAYVYYNRCPHLGLPLEWQADQFLTADKSLIQCATHGALFEVNSGACISGPCQGQALRSADTYIENNYLYLCTN